MIVESRYVSKISVAPPEVGGNAYPFNVPAVKNLNKLELDGAVTFFIGENGVGKSTLIEAIAVKAGMNAEGGSGNSRFKTRDSHSSLFSSLRIEGFGKPKRSYFLRAESFYNFANYLDDDAEDRDGYGPPLITNFGGKSLNSMSHGESFWTVIDLKLGENGLYILDEPESALSPTRLLALVYKIKELSKKNCQFIISTHSPILLSCPNARIYEFTESNIIKSDFQSCSLVNIYKRILNNPDDFYTNDERI